MSDNEVQQSCQTIMAKPNRVIEPMGEVEARATLIQIRGNLKSAANLITEFDQRLGWRVLGYEGLDACILAEFGKPNLRALIEEELGYSQAYSYRLAAANEVAANVQQFSPTGETVMVKERWVRDSGITKLDPPKQAEAIQAARELAKSEGGRDITTRHVSQAVEQVKAKEQLFTSTYYVVTHLVVTGKISRDAGLEMNAALEALAPRIRGQAVQLIGKFGITCPALLAPIGEMLAREGTERASKVLPEVLRGYLGGKRLREATLTDLENAKAEAAKEHQAEAVEARRKQTLAEGRSLIEPVNLIVWPGDKEKTIKALNRDLGEARLSWLIETLVGL
jgi:hypothetical protein